MILDLIQPIQTEQLIKKNQLTVNHIYNQIDHYKGQSIDWSKYDLALISIEEDRQNPNDQGCIGSAEEIRKSFYKLFNWEARLKMIDLGQLVQGETIADSYAALGTVVNDLIEKNVLPIIIGGTHDFTYGQFLAYENLKRTINMVVVDESVDLHSTGIELNSQSFLYKILAHQPNYLFNYSQLGYQNYLVDPQMINTLEKLFFDCYRLGYVRQDLKRLEPAVRNADLFSMDLSCLRYADAPGQKFVSPHGFPGEEACRLVRYAGLSDQISSFGLYEFYPNNDPSGLTAQLAAQLIWHFVDGFYARKNEKLPLMDGDFLKYTVSLDDEKHDIEFIKSKRSDRWWMRVPVINQKSISDLDFEMIPCLYEEYEEAMKKEIPDRWINAYIKFSQIGRPLMGEEPTAAE